jgi:hypothetical protein
MLMNAEAPLHAAQCTFYALADVSRLLLSISLRKRSSYLLF